MCYSDVARNVPIVKGLKDKGHSLEDQNVQTVGSKKMVLKRGQRKKIHVDVNNRFSAERGESIKMTGLRTYSVF